MGPAGLGLGPGPEAAGTARRAWASGQSRGGGPARPGVGCRPPGRDAPAGVGGAEPGLGRGRLARRFRGRHHVVPPLQLGADAVAAGAGAGLRVRARAGPRPGLGAGAAPVGAGRRGGPGALAAPAAAHWRAVRCGCVSEAGAVSVCHGVLETAWGVSVPEGDWGRRRARVLETVRTGARVQVTGLSALVCVKQTRDLSLPVRRCCQYGRVCVHTCE